MRQEDETAQESQGFANIYQQKAEYLGVDSKD